MGTRATGLLLVLGLVVSIVVVDVSCFRGASWTWERLAANVGIVLLFGAFWFRYR